MAILSTFAFDPEIAEALEESFERAGLNPQIIGEDHLDSAFRSLKYMLNSEWSNYGIRQWMVVQATQTMSVNLEKFDLPAGAIDILQAVLRRQNRDTPMHPISRGDYLEIADKTLKGRPDRYFADKRFDKITVYLWRRGENTTDVMIYNYFRQLSDVGNMRHTFHMPTHTQEAFIAGLAAKLAWKWNRQDAVTLQTYYRGNDPDKVGGVLKDALMESRERVDTRIQVRL